ncbi:MAG: DUF547 domain-containing protein [Paracoccaceae bacterium]
MTLDRRRFLALAAAGAALPGPVPAAPAARLIARRWPRFGSEGGPDHGAWGAFLSRFLRTGTTSGVNLVDYAGAKRERGAVAAYVDALSQARPTAMTRAAAKAYWINLYNAVTIGRVLDAYPVASIRDVGGGTFGSLFGAGPWGETLVTVEGAGLSLDDIEHGILRPVFGDPLIHYGGNCASIGCPNLVAEPYTAARVDAMLREGARAYAGHPRGATVGNDGLVVSSIYDWFEADFGGSEAGVIEHIATHAPAGKAERVRAAGAIAGDRYDWTLNDTTTAA